MAQGQGKWAKLALAACQLASVLPVLAQLRLLFRLQVNYKAIKSCFVDGLAAVCAFNPDIHVY